MSESGDRSIRDSQLLRGLIAVLGISVVGVSVFFWLRAKAPEPSDDRKDRTAHQLIQPAFRNEPLALMLIYPLNGVLAAAQAPVKRQPDLQAQAREAIVALLQDQRAAQAAVLRDIKLRAFYLDGRGTAYIDLSTAQEQVRASAWDEQLALYAMVNTLSQNFEEIKQVAFLVEGHEAQSLAGHLDLSRRYTKRMDLVK
jgi:hypothetical protein